MGLLSKITDPLGIKKKSAEAVGLGKVHKAMTDPFGVGEKLEGKTKEALGFDFEKFHLKEIGKDLLRNPERMFMGSLDPMSTKMWNKVLGRDDKPIINQMGGPAEHRYADYIAQGGDPEAAENAARAHQVAGAVASIYAGGALGAAAGAGAGSAGMTVTPAMQTAMTTGARMAVPVGAAMADAEFSEDPLSLEEEFQVTGPPAFRNIRVPGYKTGGYASPAQARLMRAVAHGWKKPGGGGPSRAVAQEFVDAKDRGMYSGGFAENRYWTGGLAAMNEINSGVEETLNFQRGGARRGRGARGRRRAALGRTTGGGGGGTTMTEHQWYMLNPGKPYPGTGTTAGTSTATVPRTGIGTPYVGSYGVGAYGPVPTTAPAPAAPTEMIALPGRESIPLGEPVDMSGYKTSGIAGILKNLTEKALTEKGYYEGAGGIWYPPESTIAGRDIPGAATSPPTSPIAAATSKIPGIVRNVVGGGAQGQWTPAQIAAWQAQQTAASRASSHRDRLRAHKSRVAGALSPVAQSLQQGPRAPGGGGYDSSGINWRNPPSPELLESIKNMPPPVLQDPNMMYPGGTPGFYAPGGPGRGGYIDADGNYVPAAAKGGYMKYQAGGQVPQVEMRPGVGGAIVGHAEGPNPYAKHYDTHPEMYHEWEMRNHIDPAPSPEAQTEEAPAEEAPAEEPGFFASLFGLGEAAEDIKTRSERELEALEQARGGHVRRFQGGGLARVAAPRGGVPPWIEPVEYTEPEGYAFGGSAPRTPVSGSFFGNVRRQPGYQQRTLGRSAPSRIAPAQSRTLGRAAPSRIAQQQRRTLAARAPRWSPQQRTAWRGAAGNPALRSAMTQQHQQRRALGRSLPQRANLAGISAQAAQQRAALARAQRPIQGRYGTFEPGMAYAGGSPGFYGPGGPGRGGSIGGGQGAIMAPRTPEEADWQRRNYGPTQIDRRMMAMRRAMGRQPNPWPGGGGNIGAGTPGRGGNIGTGIPGGPRVPPNMRGFLQKQRMMNRPPANVGGGVNRVGQQDQRGALSRALQRGTGRPPMSRRAGFPGGR